MLRVSVFVLSLLSLIACKSDSKIEIYQADKILTAITDKATKAKIKKAFDNKQAIVFKRMPEFEYRVLFSEGETDEEWLLSKYGAIKLIAPEAPTYKIELDIDAILQAEK